MQAQKTIKQTNKQYRGRGGKEKAGGEGLSAHAQTLWK
jgi:hypothetical protein